MGCIGKPNKLDTGTMEVKQMSHSTNEQKNVKKAVKPDSDPSVKTNSGLKSEDSTNSMIVEEDGIRAIGGA